MFIFGGMDHVLDKFFGLVFGIFIPGFGMPIVRNDFSIITRRGIIPQTLIISISGLNLLR
jgi:hypothetical protein